MQVRTLPRKAMDNVHQHPAIQIFQLKLLRRKPAVTPSQGPTTSVAAAAAAPPAPASAEAAETTAAIHSNAGSPRTAGTSAVAGNVSSANSARPGGAVSTLYSEAVAALLPAGSAAC